MPHSEHRKKTHRKAEEARERNRATRAGFKTAIKRARAAAPGSKEGTEAFAAVQQSLDKAARHRTIHPNKAARMKSRLSKSMKSPAAPAATK